MGLPRLRLPRHAEESRDRTRGGAPRESSALHVRGVWQALSHAQHAAPAPQSTQGQPDTLLERWQLLL
jgi:hypothetical protein